MDLTFLKAFLTKPQLIGSVVPSSPQLARMMIHQAGLKPGDRIIEIGPGTGAITKHLLECLKSPSQYFGIDINEEFVAQLRKRFGSVRFEAGSAERLHEFYAKPSGRTHADHVISSLPWTILPSEVRVRILASVAHVLRDGGTFTTFTYVHGTVLPHGKVFLQQLEEYFQDIKQSSIVWRNLPPAMVFHGAQLTPAALARAEQSNPTRSQMP